MGSRRGLHATSKRKSHINPQLSCIIDEAAAASGVKEYVFPVKFKVQGKPEFRLQILYTWSKVVFNECGDFHRNLFEEIISD